MSSLFKNNAYQILGLDISSPQKDIVKRGKEILNLLKIDESPNYKTDINLYKDSRTSNDVKQSSEDLSKPEKRVMNFFFWFDFRDTVDEKALNLIKEQKFDDAFKLWEDAVNKNNSQSFFYKKNLAILYSILFDIKGKNNYLKKSISYWNSLIKDEKYWLFFYKNYKLYDDLDTREDILLNFKNEAIKYLADFYLDVSKKYRDKSIFEYFYKEFKVKGSKIDDAYLKDIYKKITDKCESLRKIVRKENKQMPLESSAEIDGIISTIKIYLKEIKELGLYDSSDVKVERDNIAEAIISLSIFLHNDHSLSEEALSLAKEASKICGTDSMKEKINKDIKTIKEVIDFKEHESQFNLIFSDIKEGNLDMALNLLNLELQKEDIPLNIREIYIKTKNDLETRLKTHGKFIKNAPSMYCINGCGTRMYGDTLYFVLIFIPIIPLSRYSVTNNGNGTYTFFGKLDLHPWQKIWKYIGLGIIGLLILSIMFSNSSSTSSTTTPVSTDENQCSDSFCKEKYSNSEFSYYDSANNKCMCKCPDEYMWNDDESGCITINYNDLCKKKFGSNSSWTGRFEGNKYICN